MRMVRLTPRILLRMLRFLPIIAAIGAILLFSSTNVPSAEAASCGRPTRTVAEDSWLNGSGVSVVLDQCYVHPFSIDGAPKRAIVYYTLDSDSTSNNIPDLDTDPANGINDWSADVGLWIEEAWTTFTGYGFSSSARLTAGDGVEEVEAWIFNLSGGLGGWCCTSEAFTLEAPMFRTGNELGVEETVIHELWHSTEYSFESSSGWINEGTAATMQDHTDATIDTAPDRGYVGRANGYLGRPQDQLTTISYPAALWWTYFMEQLGSEPTEPGLGVDAQLDFWRSSAGNGLSRLDQVILDRSDGERNLESLWCDFTVANYVKNLGGTGIPARYRYVDEGQAPGAYDFDNDPTTPPVRRELDLPLAADSPGVIEVTDAEPWSAQYFRVLPGGDVPIINLEFSQDTNQRVCYTLLVIKDDSLVQEIRSVGQDFSRAVANNEYDEVVVILATFAEFVNYRYSINGTTPVLNIIDPLQARPVLAGDPMAPDKFLIRVEVLSPLGGGTPVQGIAPAEFEVTVGGMPAALVPPGSYVQGQYWLLIQPPTQAASGPYNLTVGFSSLSDIELNAVRYASRTDTDNLIIIDRSGSMGDFNKMKAAQDGARLYVDSWQTGDKIGVVSFNDNSRVDLTLRDWTTTPTGTGSREQAFSAIDGLTPGGATSIGDGLFSGLSELGARGDGDHDWALIVLSDGLENRSEFIDDFLRSYNDRMDAMPPEQVPVVHSIAIGPDANRGKLQDLSTKTGGIYLFVAEPPAASAGSRALAPDVDLPNDLAEYYRVIAETLEYQQQIFSARGSWVNSTLDRYSIPVEAGTSEAIFSVNWHGFSGPGPITLRSPDGTSVAPQATDRTHQVFRVGSPRAGQWLLTVAGCAPSVEFCQGKYLVEAAVKSQLTMDLYFVQPVEERRMAAEMPILVHLTDSGPILGAQVKATVVIPELRGALAILPGETRELTLFDDGSHGDGGPDDGIYGNVFREALRPGSYIVTSQAEGVSGRHGAFSRRAIGAFDVAPDRDTDGDGMVDGWEISNGLDPNFNDSRLDPDMDGLRNLDEYNRGTRPLDSDTDKGGENDGSEVKFESDPLEAADDQVPPVLSFSAPTLDTHFIEDLEFNPITNANVLNFSPQPEHSHLVLMRSTQPTTGYQVRDPEVKPTGLYIDQRVLPDTPYYYKLMASSSQGHQSAVIGPIKATPKMDPFRPEGDILINGGAASTPSLDVVLSLEASPDTVEMMIANDASFRDARWEPYLTEKDWRLSERPGPGARAFVYAQFRDRSSNLSETATDSISLDEVERVCGDQNGDGKVDVFDVVIDLQIIGGLIEPGPEQITLSDVVRDGAINILDAILMLQHIVGSGEIAGCGPPDDAKVIFHAGFNRDQVNSPPDPNLPGDPEGDSIALAEDAGFVLVRSTLGDLTDQPLEVAMTGGTGGVNLRGRVAGQPPDTGAWVVSWKSLAQPGPVCFAPVVVRDSSSLILASVAYRPDGELSFNNSAIETSYTANVAQSFQITIDLDARTTSLSIDGTPEDGAQNRPFYEAAASNIGQMNLEVGCTTEQAYALDDMDIRMVPVSDVSRSAPAGAPTGR